MMFLGESRVAEVPVGSRLCPECQGRKFGYVSSPSDPGDVDKDSCWTCDGRGTVVAADNKETK